MTVQDNKTQEFVVLFLRHILSSKALQPLLALVSYGADEEQ